jgi:cyclomaltodextrinase / maltogenic alpha-amylase / neopullulanase
MTRASSRRTVWSDRLLAALLFLSFVSTARAQSLSPHRFTFDASKLSEKPKSVNLAGSFNGWSAIATPMSDANGDGVYEAELKLADGVHFYKFVVNGNQWHTDPKSDKELEQPDGHGGMNSAVLIGPDVRKLAPPEPNHVAIDGALFDPQNPADLVRVDGVIRFRVRSQAGDVDRVRAVFLDERQMHTDSLDLHRLSREKGFDVWGACFSVDVQRMSFFFIDLLDERGKKPFAPGQLRKDNLIIDERGRKFFAKYEEIRPWPLPPPSSFVTPEWAKHAVWYQIFPERFRNGDPSNDPGDKDYERLVRWQSDWWKAQTGEAPGEANFYQGQGNVWKRRYGGDIQGVKQALPYLRRLGVNAIYFNPVFEADSMHKYDASDYRHIDDNFGKKGDLPIAGETDDPATWKWSESDKIFLDFVQEAHKQGFKVIIDGVFNHVGMSHPFFQDVLKHGKNSRYADWFEITDWGTGGQPGTPGGIQWRAWDKPNGHLPVFKKDEKLGLVTGPREHVFAVTQRWLAPDGDPSKGVDGWRLDVPGDIPHPFWMDWRKVVKGAKPDAYITGELWDWAQPWLQGDQFDAVMNYRFAVASQDFFVDQKTAITPTEFNSRLNQMVYAYPLQVAMVNQNLFDSHDTDRLASMFVNPDLEYDAGNRLQDNGAAYKKDKPTGEQWARMRQAVTFQMCFLGAPMIYYGDEAGMWSPDDPSNRMPMWWKDHEPFENPQFKFDEQHFAHYQRVIAIRNKFPALRTGFFRPVLIDDQRGVYAFVRELGEERAYVVLNRSGKDATVEVPVEGPVGLIDWMNPQHAGLKEDGERPAIVPKDGAEQVKTSGGKALIDLKAYGTAVLAAPK